MADVENDIGWDYMSLDHYKTHLKFFKKQPLLGYRTAKGYFKRRVLDKPVLRSVEFAVTYECQLKCEKCFAAKFKDPKRKYLTVDQIKYIWDQCYALGAAHVNITGGEPLIRPDILDVIKVFKPRGTLISLVTNSLALTPELARKLKKAGLNTLQISLDSADPKTHDEWRGNKGCYDKVMKAVDMAHDAGLNVCFTCVATHQNIRTDELPKMAEIAKKKNCHLLVNFAGRSGAWSERDDVVLTKEDRKVLNKYMKNPVMRLSEMFNYYGIPGLCIAGKEKINVSAYGDVYPCTHIHLAFGNALEEPIEVLWKRMREFSYCAKMSTDCLRCDNEEFIKKYLDPIARADITPLHISEFDKKK